MIKHGQMSSCFRCGLLFTNFLTVKYSCLFEVKDSLTMGKKDLNRILSPFPLISLISYSEQILLLRNLTSINKEAEICC